MANLNDFPENLIFWESIPSGKDESNYLIHNDKLIEFCSKYLGYYNCDDYTGNYILVKKELCIIKEARIPEIKQDIKKFLIDQIDFPEVWRAFAAKPIITENFIHLLDTLPNSRHNISSKEKAYFFYKNTVVEVTKNQLKLIAYEKFTGIVWKQQIINRELILSNEPHTSEMEIFSKHLCNDSEERFLSLRTVLGYLLHPFKNPSISKAVILLDENTDFSGAAHGGTGKSMLAKALSQIVPMVWKDGKNFNPRETFVFDDIRSYHGLLYFDDVKKDLSLENFYSLITGHLTQKRKFKDSVTLEYSITPKLLISSNYMVKGSGGNTDERRKIEIEIFPYYSKEFTPRDEFGHNLFDDWTLKEWCVFDLFMLNTVSAFLSNGIINPPQVNLKINKLKLLTSPEFVDYLENEVDLSKPQDKGRLLKEIIEYSSSNKIISGYLLKQWINLYAEYKGLRAFHYKSNGRAMVRFTVSQNL